METSVLLPLLLPLPGLNQTVDHCPQSVPVQAEAPPTAALHEAGPLITTAYQVSTDLKQTSEYHAGYQLTFVHDLKKSSAEMFKVAT